MRLLHGESVDNIITKFCDTGIYRVYNDARLVSRESSRTNEEKLAKAADPKRLLRVINMAEGEKAVTARRKCCSLNYYKMLEYIAVIAELQYYRIWY